MKGYMQVYTGDGKGKTTAALGLAIRAAGAGHKVFIGQFIKEGNYSEINALKRFDDLITVEQYGLGRFIKGKPSKSDIAAAREGLKKMTAIAISGEYKVVIMDEANIALYYKLFSVDDFLHLVMKRAEETELVVTGRYALDAVVEQADLVTEMKAVKHYYEVGVQARTGVEK